MQHPEAPWSAAMPAFVVERSASCRIEGQPGPVVGELPVASIFGKQVFGETEHELARERVLTPRHDSQPQRRQPGGQPG